jgi:predicted nicotinamide N-methyase
VAPSDPEAFIRANTTLLAPPHVPEITLHLADEAHDLWLKTEEELGVAGLPPPFWAFAWAGGQGLARHILDNRDRVAGRRVLDFATGSGIVAIAARMAGAATVLASDTDPWAMTAARLNARLNDVELHLTDDDLVDTAPDVDLLLAGDVFYDKAMVGRLLPWFAALAERGTTILVGDPGRSYLPKSGLEKLAEYEVPVLRALEDSEVKHTTVWRFKGPQAIETGE